ncbi:MAG: hypothetical protein MK211_00375 [Flavobacteriales bacterium]|nr:hypothetical protein [Flavobacteriales bacterium]
MDENKKREIKRIIEESGILKELEEDFILKSDHNKLLEFQLRNIEELKERNSKLEKRNSKLEKSNEQLKDKARILRSELSEVKGKYETYLNYYVFDETKLFSNYYFKNSLPELRNIYGILKKFKVFNSTFGNFCWLISIGNRDRIILTLPSKIFTFQDLGFLLYLMKKLYDFPNMEFDEWLKVKVAIISSRGNTSEIEEFSRKYIRKYDNAKNLPKNFALINEKLSHILQN